MLNIFGKSNRQLAKQLAEVQHSIDILTYRADTDLASTGNGYKSTSEQVTELAKKYEGIAEWGSQFARNIVDVRAAFTIGNGVKLQAREDGKAQREIKFLENFLRVNNLDEEVPLDWARESEIEGRILIRLFPGTAHGEVFARFIPWTHTSYTVKHKPGDYAIYDRAEWTDPGGSNNEQGGKPVNLDEGEFVFKRMGGRIHKVNDTPPKAGAVLTEMESIHKALTDWRKINKLFASPTPHFKVEDARHIKDLEARLKQIKWKIGKVLITNSEFSMVGIDGAGIESLRDEITMNAKIISGNTGVPVHFLGFPELMSNRNTADNLLELVVASTAKERSVWAGAYEELFAKAIALANDRHKMGLDPLAVKAEIPQISAAKIKELQEVWLPIYEAGALSLEGFLSRIPEIDAPDELKRIREAEEEAATAALKALKISAHGDDGGGLDDEESTTGGKTKKGGKE